MPSASSPTPSSIAEQSIPGDLWPRMVLTPRRSSMAGGRVPGWRVGNEVAGLDVRRPGHDPDRPGHDAERRERAGHLAAEIEVSELQVRRSGDRPTDVIRATTSPSPPRLDRTHLGAGVDECFDDGCHGRVEGRVVAQPAQRELHGAGRSGAVSLALSGTRKRTSLS